ncbi:sulfatase-like hydrolase/transferase [Vibrio sp. SM6]|uniref:Sulfatase-like hydrolase/transferase n=1 Tax=Vibrio agarilyticus TaxID=2726741 RepID=A0A7X8TP56_9VIBR|nr:sulfatase-like hydrolase/transferase [Vibrio agarilyticus]NLS12150.1 sulfatase-like hydrolase/transferase [Vibrio agarilyticus]
MLKRPNILLLFTDQQRKDSLGCYGNEQAVTPNVDALAEQGAKFDHYFTQAPICGPSRVSLLSGRYASSHGIGCNGPVVPENLLTIQKRLKPYGYKTANFGKLHFLPHSFRDHREFHPDYGFDEYVISDEPGCYDDPYTEWVKQQAPEQLQAVRTALPSQAKRFGKPEYSDRKRDPETPFIFDGDERLTHSSFVTELTKDFIQRHAESRDPFFCIAGYYAPHAPVNPPARFLDLYRQEEMPLPKIGANEVVMEKLRGISDTEWQEIRRHYMALVSHVDDCVGQVIATLKESGQYDDTIIVFVSDHGEYLGDHGRVQKGMPGEDVITNVPFIIHYPKGIRPQACTELVESVDWLPTMLELAGIPIARDLQGTSLAPLLRGETDEHKSLIITEQFEPNGLRQVSVRDYQYRYYCDSDGKELLFDLTADPAELESVADLPQYQAALSQMRFKMLQKIQQVAYPNVEKIFAY